MEPIDYESRIKELEKSVRILQKKLERSEIDRQQLENASDLRESVLKSVIRNLEASEVSLKQRTEELETTLTNLKSVQMKLIESEKMSALGVLVAGIAHEINNPVSFIYGNLFHAHRYFQDLITLIDLYQYYYPEPASEIKAKIEKIELSFLKEDLEKLFKSMSMGANRIEKIVKSLRTFSRLDEAELKKIDIHEGIDSTLVILNSRLKFIPESSRQIEVIRNYGKLPLINCYAGQLNQVFMNIIANAIDALEEMLETTQTNINLKSRLPTIEIITETINDDWVVVRIRDNGLGMSEKVRSKLFNPFFTTKDIGKGTGLGLSISYQHVVELHAGKLECNSTLGNGSEFVISIPSKKS
ncbi:sensor histidine kinase [Calothrix sp. PCC 6303]|uniref:sensor histidine kinase n=1 Tax=Calothrix sp. PCC 6303 TaxID=1170562 RepID=UPI0002A04EFF|nr:ATP-binding protein [Calothrix sp. PCC 6303]AFZ02985.1 histidine kinase [Calothrix sp. PCC 6303]